MKVDHNAPTGKIEAGNLRDSALPEHSNIQTTSLPNGIRYWAIIAALSVTALLPAVEGTVVSTALPTIVDDISGGQLYVWVVNSYFLTR